MNFCMEHKREATGCYFIYTYLRIVYVGYVYVNTFRDWAIAPSMLCAILQERVPFIQSTIIYVYIRVCMQTFFPEYAGDFPPAGMQIDQKKKERGQRKNIFWYEEQRRVSSPATCRAAIFDNCQRQRNAPSPPSPCVKAINLYLQT